MEKNKCGNRYSPEVRERAVRMVFEHQDEFDSQSAAIKSIAPGALIGMIAPIARLPAALVELRVALHHRQRRSDPSRPNRSCPGPPQGRPPSGPSGKNGRKPR